MSWRFPWAHCPPRRTAQVVLSFLLLPMSAWGAATASPTLLPIGPLGGSGGGIIAFYSSRNGQNDLYVMNADGSAQTLVPGTSTPEFIPPHWSPDGQTIVYAKADGIYAVDVVDLSNGVFAAPRRIAPMAAWTALNWTPDGRLLFNMPFEGDEDVWVMDADGGNRVNLTHAPGPQYQADMSPDGSKIVFTVEHADSQHLCVMDADGGNWVQLTYGYRDFSPTWSRDGRSIAFNSQRPGHIDFDLCVIDADGANPRWITDSPWHDEFASWSQDGGRITYENDTGNLERVCVVLADGRNPTPLTNGDWNDAGPDWRPVPPPLDAGIHVEAEAVGRDVRVHWNPSPWPDVLRYDVYRGTVAQQPSPTLAGSTSDTSFTDPGRFGTLYYRVRAVRAADQSLFSNEDTVTACARTASFFPGGSSALAPVIDDFNHDGIPDLALANGLTAGTVSILLGQGAGGTGDGSFAAPLAYPAGATPTGLVAGDFNEDGIPDLAVANYAASGTFSVLLGQGSAGVGDGSFAAPVSYPVGSGPTAIAAADLDEDGITDLLVACRGSSTVSVARGRGSDGTGDGTFAPATSFPAGLAPVALATGDFDHDGITDLALVASNVGRVSLLRGLGAAGHGNGSFAPAVTCNVASVGGIALTTGDFNEDGATDLAVALNTATNGVAILRGLGDGTFATAVRYAAGAAPGAIAVGDFDGDGVADLALVDRAGSAVSCLLGQSSGGIGNGTFGTPFAFPVGAAPSGLALGDFDQDGRPDLAVTHASGTQTVALLPEPCEAGVPGGLRLLVPDGGQSWLMASEQLLAWERDRGVVAVDLELSRDGGARWETLATGLTGTHFTWTVTGPATGSATALVRIHDSAVPARSDQSSAPFTIATNLDAPGPGNPRCELRLEGAFPSPARAPLSVAFTLPDDAPATLELIDVAGRRLASPAVGALGPGRHVVQLAGTRALPSGVYFLRLRHGARQLVARAVLMN